MARNRMSNTDMQDKYCGDCYDIHPNQGQYKGNPKQLLGLHIFFKKK